MKKAKRLILSFLTLMVAMTMQAQQEISGNVVDPEGEPIIGATVMEKGTSNGVITDIDGNFRMKVQTGATLVFTYIGYQTQELPAQNGLQVVLSEDATELAEVVVVGYQTQRKADLTGSVAVVKTEELRTSSDTDPIQRWFTGGCRTGSHTWYRLIQLVAGPPLHY